MSDRTEAAVLHAKGDLRVEQTTLPAPGRLSTTIVWPQASPSAAAAMRATMSLPPPGASGTITRTGRTG